MPISPLRIGIAGAGRMGQAIASLIDKDETLHLAGMWSRGGRLGPVAEQSDVLIDFSLPEATDTVLATVLEYRLPLVCGVSGLSAEHMAGLDRAAGVIPVVYDRNMSLGIAVLENLVRRAASALGPNFSVAVHETHHVHKIDAPSGTALKLGEAIAATLGLEPGQIRYHSERRGEVPGDHAVIFSSATETLRLEHSVTSRGVFAEGALQAARWAAGREPGRYTMHDVLE